jgi:hypothetical protein
VLPKALWYKKRVQIARSTVLRYQSLSALVTIGYVAFDVSTQALSVITRSDELERLSLSWVHSVKRNINKPKELCVKVVIFWDH